MTDQFFGKPFWIVLGGLAAMFFLSIFLFKTVLALPFLFLVIIAAASITYWRPEYGILTAFAELFAHSHGHAVSASLFGFSFSLRMAIFVGVMLGYAALLLFKKAAFPWRDRRLRAFLPLFGGILIGFLIGVLRHPVLEAFKDGNAYLYLAYVFPILSIEWTSVRKRLLIQTLFGASFWVVMLTLGLLFVFTHFSAGALSPIYAFIRDTRTGELTSMGNGIFRIFLQSQFSAAVSLLIFFIFGWLVLPFAKQARVSVPWLSAAAMLFSAIFISLSRSLWIGILGSGLFAVLLIAWRERPNLRASVATAGRAVASVALGFFLLVLVVMVPPRRASFQGISSLISARATTSEDVAVSSRWNLLSPLMEEIREAPILGKGFGEPVTFLTDDPRARAISPDGTWTATAFEWGWLDVWLKTGLPGVIGFFLLLWAMARGLWPEKQSPQAWIGYGAATSLFMLYLTNIFTPYLNHPLGLGLVLFWIPFLKQKAAVLVFAKTAVLETAVQTNAAPVMSACPRMNLGESVGEEPSA